MTLLCVLIGVNPIAHAQDHANFGHVHTTRNCHGHDMTKAVGWSGSDICPIGDIKNSDIDDTRFAREELGSPPDYSLVSIGEIVNWGSDHSSYVTNKYGSTASDIEISQVPNEGGSIETGTLQWVINNTAAAGGQPPTFTYSRISYSVTLKNDKAGYNGGPIILESTQYTSPKYVTLYPGENEITIEAVDESINGVDFAFNEWTNSDNTTTYSTRQITVSPTSSPITYTANFIGTPDPVNRVDFISAVGDPIEIDWDEHPNSSVEYNVWRWVKDVHDWIEIGTVPYGTTTYTDQSYTRTSSYSHDLLEYGVEVHYIPHQTTSGLTTTGGTYGRLMWKNNSREETADVPLPAGLQLTAFPNPFDGRATIEYVLPESESVRVNVYDVEGRRVRTLLDRQQGAGPQAVVWDGRSDFGMSVSAGLYLVRLETRFGSLSRQITLLR